MKTIIEIWGGAKTGKSQGIKAAALSYPFVSLIHPWGKDEYGEYWYDNYIIGHYTTEDGRDVIVGLENQGDPDSCQEEWIEACIHEECEIIVCACRSRGDTRKFVRETAAKKGYQLVEITTPFHFNGEKNMPNGLKLVDFFSEYLNDLVKKCIS